MTIQNLIDKIQEEKPNTFTDAKMVSFINEIESDVAAQVNMVFKPYTTAEDMNKELMVPAPYDRLYVSYLKAMVDYANEEYASYQLNQEQHLQDFADFLNWVVRTGQSVEDYRMPKRFRNTMY
jgi:hypothetical protein